MDAKKLKEKFQQVKTNLSLFKDVEYQGMKIRLEPLTGEQEIEVAQATKEMSDLVFLLNIKKETLCRSIVSIDGEDLGDTIKDGDLEIAKSLWMKNNILGKVSQVELDALFNAYMVLQVELDEKIKTTITFTNGELMNKYIEQEVAKKAVSVVQKMADQVTDDKAPTKEVPAAKG